MGTSQVAIATEDQGVTRVVVNQGSPGTLVLASAVSGKRHRVVGALLTLPADGTLKFSGSSTGDLTGPLDIGQRGGFVQPNIGDLIITGPSEDLTLTTTLGGAHGVVKILTA
jgi:hypothetical protein